MTEQLRNLFELSEDQRNLIISFREHNLRIAGDENRFQPFWRFKVVAFPDIPEIRKIFEFETKNGRIWFATRIMPGEQQFAMKTTNKGTHVDIWGRNVLVRLPEEDDE